MVREAVDGREAERVGVSIEKVGEMAAELVLAFVVVASASSMFVGLVHAFDLTICQGVFWLVRAVLDPEASWIISNRFGRERNVLRFYCCPTNAIPFWSASNRFQGARL